MTSSLAPALGRLAAPPTSSPWEPIRLRMVDELVAAHDNGHLDGAAWLTAWLTAVTAMRDRVVDDAVAALERAAIHSRMPITARNHLMPSADAADVLLQRMLAEGIALESLESAPDDPEIRRRRGAALEEGWTGAVRVATLAAGRYHMAAQGAQAWRRPWWPLIVGGTVATAILMVVAAMIAGLLDAPQWFRPIVDWFWGLPWP